MIKYESMQNKYYYNKKDVENITIVQIVLKKK